jgi:hypothetical protein
MICFEQDRPLHAFHCDNDLDPDPSHPTHDASYLCTDCHGESYAIMGACPVCGGQNPVLIR